MIPDFLRRHKAVHLWHHAVEDDERIWGPGPGGAEQLGHRSFTGGNDARLHAPVE